MTLNIDFIGTFFLAFMSLIGILSYYLGRRKTNTPVLATFIGILLAFIPPLALIYLIVLVIKADVKTATSEH